MWPASAVFEIITFQMQTRNRVSNLRFTCFIFFVSGVLYVLLRSCFIEIYKFLQPFSHLLVKNVYSCISATFVTLVVLSRVYSFFWFCVSSAV
jgi:hypothetical protein